MPESSAAFSGIGEIRYQDGLQRMQQRRFREAIYAFMKASFFVPHKPEPLIAAAECCIALCDFQGAVKLYRHSLWLLHTHQATNTSDGVHKESPNSIRNRTTSLNMVNIRRSSAYGKDERERASIDENFCRLSLGRSALSSLSDDRKIHLSPIRPSVEINCDNILVETVRRRLAGILDALSIVLFNVKDYLQALRFAEDSLELFQHPQVSLHRCAYLVALGREDEAEKALERHQSENLSFMIESGSLLVHLYCLRQAFRRAKGLLDNVPQEQRKLPQYILSLHIFENAYAIYRERAIKKADLQALTQCLNVFPEDVTLLFERAKFHISNGMEKKAIPDLFVCIKLSNGQFKSAIELMTKTLFHVGSTLDGQNSVKEAIEYYTTSLLWNPENIEVILARGDCYMKAEVYDKALQDFKRVNSIFPRHPDATRRIAYLHDIWGTEFVALGKLEDAEREFSNAIVTCDTEPLFYFHRAQCRFDMNEPRYALRDVLSCKQLNPKERVIQDFILSHLGNAALTLEQRSSESRRLPDVSPRADSRVLSRHGRYVMKSEKNAESPKLTRRQSDTRAFQAKTMLYAECDSSLFENDFIYGKKLRLQSKKKTNIERRYL